MWHIKERKIEEFCLMYRSCVHRMGTRHSYALVFGSRCEYSTRVFVHRPCTVSRTQNLNNPAYRLKGHCQASLIRVAHVILFYFIIHVEPCKSPVIQI